MNENEKIVLDFLEVFHTSNPDWVQMASFLAADAYYHVRVPDSEKFVGPDNIRHEIETQFKLYEDCICEIHSVGSNDNHVFMERTDHVTMKHNGRRVSAQICCAFEVNAAGKITAWRDYYDAAAVYKQIGLSEEDLYKLAD